jgi:NAD(P)-dependent dehydrogenase (short-subunit alcohol dehydrogenase family)
MSRGTPRDGRIKRLLVNKPWPPTRGFNAGVAWAASDQASFLTGATTGVDGGMSMCPKFA